MKNITALQAIVNELSEQVGGIDSVQKIREAQAIARDKMSKDPEWFLGVINEAIQRRFTTDSHETITAFLRQAGANL